MKELKRKLMFVVLILGISLGGVSLVNGATQWSMNDLGSWEFFDSSGDLVDLDDLEVTLSWFNSSDFLDQKLAIAQKMLGGLKEATWEEGYNDVLINKEKLPAGVRVDQSKLMPNVTMLGYKVPLSWTNYREGDFKNEKKKRIQMFEDLIKFLNE